MAHFNEAKEIAEQSEKDWKFGAFSPICLSQGMKEIDRASFLPNGEVQRGKDDMMDCASRSPINILETKFNYLIRNGIIDEVNYGWLVENGYLNEEGEVEFSDAFVAINSGTDENGNSLKAPLESLRSKKEPDAIQGLIPKSMLPLEKWMSFSEYHNPARVTPKMQALGKEFAKRFIINYERVERDDFAAVLKEDMLNVAAYAWPEPENGEYPRVNKTSNHAFMLFATPMAFAFDNYFDDGVTDDYVKKLASDYDYYGIGYRVIISAQRHPESVIVSPVKTWIETLLELIRKWVNQYKTK